MLSRRTVCRVVLPYNKEARPLAWIEGVKVDEKSSKSVTAPPLYRNAVPYR